MQQVVGVGENGGGTCAGGNGKRGGHHRSSSVYLRDMMRDDSTPTPCTHRSARAHKYIPTCNKRHPAACTLPIGLTDTV